MRSSIFILLALLAASCASQDPLWAEQQSQEKFEALQAGCKQLGGVIVIRHARATKLKKRQLTRWEMASAQCARLN